MPHSLKLPAILGLAVIGFTGLPSAKAQNILQNPGFESGSLGPWYQGRDFNPRPGENWNVTSTSPNSGTFSATEIGNKELRQDFGPVDTGQITQVSFYAKEISNFGSTGVAYDFFYTDGTDGEFSVYTTTSKYQFFDVTSSLTPGKQLVGFSVFGVDAGPTNPIRLNLDDVTINVAPPAVPEASTTVSLGLLLALGVGGLVFASKRKGSAVS